MWSVTLLNGEWRGRVGRGRAGLGWEGRGWAGWGGLNSARRSGPHWGAAGRVGCGRSRHSGAGWAWRAGRTKARAGRGGSRGAGQC